MNVKPTRTTKVFTVEHKWVLKREEVEKIICNHLGIPHDHNVNVDLMEYGESEVSYTTVDRQTE